MMGYFLNMEEKKDMECDYLLTEWGVMRGGGGGGGGGKRMENVQKKRLRIGVFWSFLFLLHLYKPTWSKLVAIF